MFIEAVKDPGEERNGEKRRDGKRRRRREEKVDVDKERSGGEGRWSVDVTKEDRDKKERISAQKTRVW